MATKGARKRKKWACHESGHSSSLQPENFLMPSSYDFLFANRVSGNITSLRLGDFAIAKDLSVA
jgi:hypothetical protein